MVLSFRVDAQLPAVSFHHLKRDVDIFSSSFIGLSEDQYGCIWFGSYGGGGLYRYDGYTVKLFLPDPANFSGSVAGIRIFDVYAAPNGMLYVGTNFGFSIVEPQTGVFHTINNKIDMQPHVSASVSNCFLLDTLHDELWIGTSYGLAKMKPDSVETFTVLRKTSETDPNVIPNIITCMLQDPKDADNLWLGTSSGLFHYNIEQNRYTRINSPTAPGLTMSVVDMYLNDAGYIWMVAGDGFVLGYNIAQQQWTIHHLTIPNELYENVVSIYKIFPAGEDEAWLSTVSSVGKLDLRTGEFEAWTYEENRPEGLLPRGVFRDIMQDRHGRMWISSWYGVQIARQTFMEKSHAVKTLKVTITGVEALPVYEDSIKPFIYTDNISFKTDQREITFQYLLPNPLNPSAVTYQYMLEGLDKDWITTDQRRVRYPKLSGGEYRFLVRGRESADQPWTETSTLSIQIPKRLNEYAWFWAVLSVLFLGLAIALYKFLVSRAKKEERLKADFEHQVSEVQMQALRAQMNPHFLFNSLNSIKYFAISKSKDETAAYLSKFSLLVRSILNNSKSRTISLKDELDALQLYIEIEHLRLDGKFDYAIDIDSSIHIRQAQIPPMILQPYVENAIWHGLMHKEGRGKLLVQVKDMGHQIQCVIEDNGIGRAKAAEFRNARTDHKKSVGMQITSDRITLINRIYKIDTQVHVVDLTDKDGQAAGTRVVINVPLIRDEEE